MTMLTDYSNLKRGGNITIPLNGETYTALADPPADVPLGSLGALQPEDLAAMATAMEAQGKGEVATLDPATNPQLTAALTRAGAAGMQQTRRALQLFQAVLLPESLARWEANMRPPDPEWPDAEQEAHRARQITLPQVMAVYNDLIAAYGQRPTTPPASSPNGHGGPGGTSTVGAQPEA